MALTIKRAETRVTLCLDGDLKAAHEAAEAEYQSANQRMLADPRLGSSTRSLAQKVLDLEAQMKDGSVTFVIRGLKRGIWTELTTEHAPREGNALDSTYGFNIESLMTAALPQSIAGVENNDGEPLPFDVATEWNSLVEDMTNSQYEDFVLAVLRVNAGRNEVPFSLSALRMTQDSGQK
jgi:hypothetical protein